MPWAGFRFKGKDDIAFTFLSFRFAPELLVIIPIYLIFQQIGLYDTYIGLIWVYQLITMPMVIWILMSYFEDISVELEQTSMVDGFPPFGPFLRVILPLAKPGIAASSLLAFIYAWNNFIFALILGSGKVQPVTVSALKFAPRLKNYVTAILPQPAFWRPFRSLSYPCMRSAIWCVD